MVLCGPAGLTYIHVGNCSKRCWPLFLRGLGYFSPESFRAPWPSELPGPRGWLLARDIPISFSISKREAINENTERKHLVQFISWFEHHGIGLFLSEMDRSLTPGLHLKNFSKGNLIQEARTLEDWNAGKMCGKPRDCEVRCLQSRAGNPSEQCRAGLREQWTQERHLSNESGGFQLQPVGVTQEHRHTGLFLREIQHPKSLDVIYF